MNLSDTMNVGTTGPEQMMFMATVDNDLADSTYLKEFIPDTLKDAFYDKNKAITKTRWDKLYPYELLIVKETEPGKFSATNAKFTLPIPPQELDIQMPFGITNTVTMGGVAEEHNGAPIRMIRLVGTTGVNPLRGSAETYSPGGMFGLGIGAGTLSAVSRLTDTAQSVLTAEPPDYTNLIPRTFEEGTEGSSTGYYQFHLLQKFLEGYAALKKTQAGKAYRLAFAIHKDESIYLVTPVMFVLRRTANSALEYPYEFQMKAFGRIKVSDLSSDTDYVSDIRSASDTTAFQQILRRIVAARQTINNVQRTVEAFRADVGQVLDVARQVGLAIKDTIGLVTTVADLPQSILEDVRDEVLAAFQYKATWDEAGRALRNMGYAWDRAFDDHKSANADPTPKLHVIKQPMSPGPSVLDDLFENPNRYMDVFDTIQVSRLSLPAAKSALVNKEIRRVRNFEPKDYEVMRDMVQSFANDLADQIGAGDPTFAEVYGRQAPASVRQPTQDDYDVLFALNDMVMDLTTLSLRDQTFQTPTMDYVAGLASSAGVAFTKPVSKYAIPFPYGMSLERLAVQYLGDPDRWMEIAVLNGLREPYVDEEGFTYALVANGKLSQVSVAFSDNLYIGQPVWIQSAYVKREKRHIRAIKKVAPGNVVLTLDGDADLAKYTTAAQAYIHAFLPDTVNSMQVIYIPSSEPGVDDTSLKKIPGVNAFDSLLEVGGIDLLLTDDNDLVITEDGDCRWAYGLANLIQRVRVTLGTPRGSLLRHPNFGFAVRAGTSIADMPASEMLKAAKDVFAGDPTIQSVNGASVTYQNQAARLVLSLSVTGVEHPLALAVKMQR